MKDETKHEERAPDARRIIRLDTSLPKTTEAQVSGKQVLRSGTFVGAHYREAHRSRSDAELISKLGGGLQELEAAAYWLELLLEAAIVPEACFAELMQETHELSAIFVTSIRTPQQRSQQ